MLLARRVLAAQCCLIQEPQQPFACDDCGWDCIDDVSGKPLNTTMVNEARAEVIEVINEIVVWEVIDRPPNVTFECWFSTL